MEWDKLCINIIPPLVDELIIILIYQQSLHLTSEPVFPTGRYTYSKSRPAETLEDYKLIRSIFQKV